MELSESDVCKLAIMLANGEEKKTLLELFNKAQRTDKILKERVVEPFGENSSKELAPQVERIEIMDSASEAKQNLNNFAETIIRKRLDKESITNKDENDGWTNETKDEREEP